MTVYCAILTCDTLLGVVGLIRMRKRAERLRPLSLVMIIMKVTVSAEIQFLAIHESLWLVTLSFEGLVTSLSESTFKSLVAA